MPGRSATPVAPPPGPVPAADADELARELATIAADDSERILRRAIAIDGDAVVVADRFPVSDLEQAAAELHVPVSAVAQALAEYRAGALDREEPGRAGSLVERMIGPSTVLVGSRTGLSEGQVVQDLGQWLHRHHRLRIRVNPEGAVVAVRRRGLVPQALRQLRGAVGRAGLSGLREVRGAAVTTDEGQTMFCVVADVSEQRTHSVVAGSAIAFGGTVVVATAAAVTAPVALVGVPVAVGTGWVVTRVTHGRQIRRIREEVEITADNVAAGARPRGRVQEVVDRLGLPGNA